VTQRRVRFGLAAVLAGFAMSLGTGPALAGEPIPTVVLIVHDVSFEQLLAVPEISSLATAGGAALMTHDDTFLAQAKTLTSGANPPLGIVVDDLGTVAPSQIDVTVLGSSVRTAVAAAAGGSPIQVVVAAVGRSPEMTAAKDELTPIVVAVGRVPDLFAVTSSPHALTSDSTRRVGVVDGIDLRATVLAALGEHAIDGSPIRAVDAPAPFELHARYLAMRRMTVPIQTAAGLYVGTLAMMGVAALAMRRRIPRGLGAAAAWIAMTVPALSLALLFAGHLPSLTYGTVVPFVVAATIAGTIAFVPVARARGTFTAMAWVGAAALAAIALEAALGWRACLTPFLGGSQLDGGRYFGLPNVYIGLMLGAGLFVAQRLASPIAGAAVLVAAALFAGAPSLGANLGGAVTLFAGAGLWYGLRTSRGRVGARTIVVTGVVTVVGTFVVLLANRYLPGPPTHITRFVEGQNGGFWSTIASRLGVGVHLIADNPFAVLPVLGVPLCLWVVLRPPEPVAAGFRASGSWRDAALAVFLGSVVAYVANDSGAAALGLGFGLGLGGLLFVSLREGAGMMGSA
jgi:hypothetical protein